MSSIPEGAVVAAADGVIIHCLATPRASRNAFAAWHDGRLKIALAAPPVDGEANKTLVRFIAESLNLPKSAVSIASGATGRRKSVIIKGLSVEDIKITLSQLVQD